MPDAAGSSKASARFDKRTDNTRLCINYVFEYFNNYLETRAADEQTVLHEEKVDKYRNILRDYDPDIQEWLVSLYSSYGKYMHRNLGNFIMDTYFLLYDSDAEFRATSYEVYPKAVKKFRFLDNQSECLFIFIKDYHRVQSYFLHIQKSTSARALMNGLLKPIRSLG
jgi:hypothetical protein